MADRVPHDAPAVSTYDGRLVTRGRTGRLGIRIPASAPVSPGEVVRLILNESTYHTRPARPINGDGTEIRGAFPTPDEARDGDSSRDSLPDWLSQRDLEAGRTVHVDVIVEGFRYGLRAPGERAVYDAGRPDQSLQDIAEDL